MAKKMTITSKAVVPKHVNAARKENVKIHAQVDCTLWFNNGLVMGLKKDGSCDVSFENDGTYEFQVEYGAPMVAVQETIYLTESMAGGNSVLTETAVMAATVRSGPTGDITVP
jgi:DNA polymerase III alpha subunit